MSTERGPTPEGQTTAADGYNGRVGGGGGGVIRIQ